jgi:hypothetical protein
MELLVSLELYYARPLWTEDGGVDCSVPLNPLCLRRKHISLLVGHSEFGQRGPMVVGDLLPRAFKLSTGLEVSFCTTSNVLYLLFHLIHRQ